MTIYYRDDRVTLHHGDCLDVLRALPDASVDSVVTDPPYGLEFMGKEWDAPWKQGADVHAEARNRRAEEMGDENKRRYIASAVNKYAAGLPFQQWCEMWATECLRVLKPGGHLLAFGGTRTWHRLACAVEDAGFEVRDSIAWLYGCLSDDTEILTSEGWVRYDRAKEGQHALAFDTATGALAWQAIQHVHRYPYAGEMVRLHSEHTDQLLTPNHRVVLDEGRSTPHTPYVPSDQDLRRLLADVPGARPLPVGAEADVLAGVRGSADLAAEEGQGKASLGAGRPHGAVRDVRDGDVEAGRLAQADRGGVLLEPVQRRAPGGGVGEALPQGQGGLDRRQPGVLSGEDDRAEQPRMEGRRYRVQEARELCRSAVRASAGMGATDGPQGRVHHGAPATDGRPLRVPADQAGSHQPREPRSQGQPTGEPDPLALEPSAQALRVGEDGGGRLLPSTGVTADVVDYAGVVWCITVPHGAFIARRNGLIFATGNSGFPKSLDVSKAIDKAAGHERGRNPDLRNGPNTNPFTKGAATHGGGWAPLVGDDNGAQTPDAERWQGWGTALKPGHEPVVCARKPFNTVPLGEEVDRLHHLIGGLLWLSLSPAKRAELASPSSPAGQHGARCASALVSAATATSPDGFAQTGMCSSPATASTSSSIASSWSSILGALSALTSTSTTSTRSSTTTALTTLSSLLAPLTSPSTMPPCACLTSGSSSSAPSAGSDSTDEWARWLHTLSASVPASAIEGTALVVASALAQVAASLSADQGAASSADPSATTGADASPSPAFEPVVVARKPLIGTVAATVLAHGTGALNIDGCRIGLASGEDVAALNARSGGRRGFASEYVGGTDHPLPPGADLSKGRWPANVVLDESQAEALDEQSGTTQARIGKPRGADSGDGWGMTATGAEYDDSGGASRFFYVAKAPASERPRYTRPKLRLRDDLTPAQVDHVRARLAEAGVQVD